MLVTPIDWLTFLPALPSRRLPPPPLSAPVVICLARRNLLRARAVKSVGSRRVEDVLIVRADAPRNAGSVRGEEVPNRRQKGVVVKATYLYDEVIEQFTSVLQPRQLE